MFHVFGVSEVWLKFFPYLCYIGSSNTTFYFIKRPPWTSFVRGRTRRTWSSCRPTRTRPRWSWIWWCWFKPFFFNSVKSQWPLSLEIDYCCQVWLSWLFDEEFHGIWNILAENIKEFSHPFPNQFPFYSWIFRQNNFISNSRV